MMLLDLVHVLGEGNKCADYLSKLERTRREQLMLFAISSNEFVQFLKADMYNVTYQRSNKLLYLFNFL